MNDNQRQQREIELAQARDRDEKARKLKLVLSLLGLVVAVRPKLKALYLAKRKSLDRAMRRHLYHEPRKGCLVAEIHDPKNSAWAHFLEANSQRDEAWFDWVTLPRESFFELVQLAEPIWQSNPTIPGGGNPRPTDLLRRKLDCAATIAISLNFNAKPSSTEAVAKQFGLTETHSRKYVLFGMSIVLAVTRKHEFSKVTWCCDDAAYVNRQRKRVQRYVPELSLDYGIWPIAWMDGVRFPIGKKRDSKRQRRDYSGEKKRHLRKIILVTDSEGVVVAAVLNCPGSWGDSKCTDLGKLYDLIEQTVPDGCSVGADTAFKGGLLPPNKVIKISKAGEYAPDGMTEAQYKELEKLLTKARQPGEWINNVLVQSFRRLRQVLGIFDDRNSDMMEFTILVHNWRAITCCRNQVKKFFDIPLPRKVKRSNLLLLTTLIPRSFGRQSR